MQTCVYLKTGEAVLIDLEDFECVSQFKWHRSKGYAYGWVTVDGARRKMLMHRFILGAAPGTEVDHRNGHGLDNRRSNLRITDHSSNSKNVRTRRGRRFKGVHYYKARDRYQAYIQKDGRMIPLGYWDRAEDAARAYDQAAVFLFGEFARTNFPMDPAAPLEMPAIPKRKSGVPIRRFVSEAEKECSRCHEVKPRSEYPPAKSRKNGDPHQARCRACDKAAAKERATA